MAATKRKPRKPKPATTAEARENQLIAAAVDLAEKQISEGTASAQVITHFLRLGTAKERLEREKLAAEHKLLLARVDALDSNKEIQKMYAEALKAIRLYGGNSEEEEQYPDDSDD